MTPAPPPKKKNYAYYPFTSPLCVTSSAGKNTKLLFSTFILVKCSLCWVEIKEAVSQAVPPRLLFISQSHLGSLI